MSDGEIVRALLAKYASQETDHDQRLSALADLEYYVHQVRIDRPSFGFFSLP